MVAVLLTLVVVPVAQTLPSTDPCVPNVYCKGAGAAKEPTENETWYGAPSMPADHNLSRYYPNRTVDVYYKVKQPDQLRPAVLMLHEGGWNAGRKENWDTRARDLANETDWVVFTVGYRWLDPQKWATQPKDVEDAILWVKAHSANYSINTSLIGMVGSSAGAHLSMLAGMKGSGNWSHDARVAAVSEWSGPTHLQNMTRALGCEYVACASPTGYTGGALVQMFTGTCQARWSECGSSSKIDRCYPDPPAGSTLDLVRCQARYDTNSPVMHVDTTDPPVQIWHARGDGVVPFSQALEMARALRANGVHVECPPTQAETDHGDALKKEAWDDTMAFLQRMLRPTPQLGGPCDYPEVDA